MREFLKYVLIYYIVILGLISLEFYKLTHAGEVSSKITFVYEAF